MMSCADYGAVEVHHAPVFTPGSGEVCSHVANYEKRKTMPPTTLHSRAHEPTEIGTIAVQI